MLRLMRQHLGLDAEQRGDEILEMRREVDDEIGFVLGSELLGRGAAGGEQREQAGIGRPGDAP